MIVVTTAERGTAVAEQIQQPLDSRKWLYRQQAKSLYDEGKMMTREEQDRLNRALIQYVVTEEVMPFVGGEREIFQRIVDLREQCRADVPSENEPPAAAAERAAEEAPHADDSAQDAPNDNIIYYNYNNNDNIINNNILYNNKIKDSLYDHNDHDNDNDNDKNNDHDNDRDNDHDHREREVFCKKDQDLSQSSEQGWVEEVRQAAVEHVIAAVETLCGFSCYSYVREDIGHYVATLGEELCLFAVERAKRYDGKTWGYVRTIMEGWRKQEIRTKEQAEAYCTNYDKSKRADKYRSTGSYNRRFGTYLASRGGNRGSSVSCFGENMSPLELEAVKSALAEE